MKAYWNDSGSGPEADDAKQVDLAEASRIWSDEVRGVQDNFFGLIGDDGRTIQFYFFDSIPDDVEDATGLEIVGMDFPAPHKRGSYEAKVTVGEVLGLIEKAFETNVDHSQFDGLEFSAWSED